MMQTKTQNLLTNLSRDLFTRTRRPFVTLLGRCFWLVLAVLTAPKSGFSQLGNSVRQVIVAQAADWNSNTAVLQCYQRANAAAPWTPVFAKPVPVLLGRAGLAWGRGVFTPPANGIPLKVEKDWRAPAGVFQLGQLFGYAPTPPGNAPWPYVRVGPYDAWIDDIHSAA
ncbi:MAG: hypothetical protein JWO94_2311, partial [Verrucomicrobiaceae bacterium]|nr:hypothetical protein [Verrucomicrobiaceae bacterium]